MLTWALVLAVLLPGLGALAVAPLSGRTARAIATIVAAAAAGFGIGGVIGAYPGGHRAALGVLPWLEGRAGSGLLGVMLDPLGSLLLVVVVAIGFLTVLYSTGYLTERNRDHAVGPQDQGRYYFWLLLFLASMAGVATAPNFLQLFVFWELTTLCSWALISFYRNDASLRAGFKALLITHAGAVFFVAALLVLFVETGSFGFEDLARLGPGARSVVFACFMLAAWAKAAQVPAHVWLPDAMAAPTPISAYLHAAAMVKAGVYLMARAASAGWAMPEGLAIVLAVMAVVTMFLALSYYFIQDDLKRLLAYSTIAHLAYVLLGVALGAMGILVGFRGGVLHIIGHGFGKATLFLCAGAIAYVTGTRSISALGGLARRMPITATAFFIGLLTVTGIPPFACFWSKFMLLAGALALPGFAGPALLILLLGETLIAFAWLLYVGQRVFFGAATPAAEGACDPPRAMQITLVLLMAGSIAAPLVGLPLVRLIGGLTP
jgi:hydrogenase-4 component D